MQRVVVLFGSEMGTAESAAEAVVDELTSSPDSHDVSLYDLSEFDVDDLACDDVYIVVCSTYGEGDLPTGAEPFFDRLDASGVDLTGMRFAIFGLGDSVYDDTFNRGGELVAEKLAARGAVQFGEHARHDASTEVKVCDMARDWARTLPIPGPARLLSAL